MDVEKAQTPHHTGILGRIDRVSRHLSRDFLGGPRVLRLSWVINLQKGATLPFVALLMILYRNGSVEAWVYLALHGSYGLCWLIKHIAFPDARWNVRITIGGALISFTLVLGLYWLLPFLLISDVLGVRPPASEALLALAIVLHTLGVALMMSSDAQRYFTLRAGSGLITDGFFRHVRRPNYLGEMMVYGSYTLVVRHWLGWMIVGWVWLAVFLPQMLLIDRSLARYAGWEAYYRRTGLIFPNMKRRQGVRLRDAPPPQL